MDPTPRRWFHASQEDSMKQFEQLTSHVAVRSGIILVATLMVFAVLSPAGRRVGVLALAATLVGLASTTVAAAENSDTAIRPFKVKVPEAQLAELRRRIVATQWPEPEPVPDASQGVQLATMQKLAHYWATAYDWRKCEARLNALPQFTTRIDGLDIHFIHVRSKHPNAMPLIVTHGWPGSIVELLKIIDPLTNPTAHGGDRRRLAPPITQAHAALYRDASETAFHVAGGIGGGVIRSFPAFARNDVGTVPFRPVVLRSGRLVAAMALFGFAQKRGQCRDVRAESSSGKSRRDLLEEPAVAIRIIEGGKREVRATLRVVAGGAPFTACVQEITLEMEGITDVDAVRGELGACGVDVIDHEERSLDGSRRRARKPLAEHDRAWRSRRSHLHQAPVFAGGEVAVQTPPQAPVESLGAFDIGHRKDDDFELQIDRGSAARAGGVFCCCLRTHCDLRLVRLLPHLRDFRALATAAHREECSVKARSSIRPWYRFPAPDDVHGGTRV
jgi:hypothetical protein